MSAIKTAPELVKTTANERKKINMEFAEDLDGDTLASVTSVTWIPAGPTHTTALSGSRLQISITGGLVTAQKYRCTAIVVSTTNAETFEGHAFLQVA